MPNNPAIQNYLGYILAEENIKLEEAKALIEKALEKEPDNAAFLDSYAWVLYRLGYYKKALDYIDKAIEATSIDPLMYEHKADILLALGEYENAILSLQKAIEKADDEEYIKKMEIKFESISGE